MSDGLTIFDGHNDVLMDYAPIGDGTIDSFFERTPERQFDLPRAQEGGVGGGMFAVFVPDNESMSMVHTFDPNQEYVLPALKWEAAQRATMAMVANLFRIEAQSSGRVKVARTVEDIETCFQTRTLAAVLHFEGAEAIDTDLDALEVFYQTGLRSLGIVWSRPTPFAEGVPFKFPHKPDTGPGLTDAGKALVRACNQLGILIDLSHLNEKGFWDVAKLSDAPLVATHSNAWELCKLPRNLTDRQLDAIREHDGLVGVNFVVLLAREDAANDPDTPLETIVRHVDYLVERLGIERVGFGSDFGAATVPNALAHVGMYPNLIAALQKAGYDDASLKKLTHENWLRVLRKTWKN